jgi:methenyltetrahydromethanopterin cyclohydrolase
MAVDLVDEAIDFAGELNVGVRHLGNDAAVLDFGVARRGGVEAGLLLAEVATGGLATVRTRLQDVGGAALAHVELSTDHPRRSLLACQSPGWPLDLAGETVRGSGPAQVSREGGAGPADVDAGDLGVDEADFAVLVVEADRVPDEDLAAAVASGAGVPTSGVFLLVAPASSIAGGVATAARVAERAVGRLVETGYEPRDVLSATGAAPVPPLAGRGAEARDRAAAAIAFGGRVHLVVDGDVGRPERLVHGGAAIEGPSIERADELPAPAQVTVDAADGPTHVVGGVDEDRLAAGLGL